MPTKCAVSHPRRLQAPSSEGGKMKDAIQRSNKKAQGKPCAFSICHYENAFILLTTDKGLSPRSTAAMLLQILT